MSRSTFRIVNFLAVLCTVSILIAGCSGSSSGSGGTARVTVATSDSDSPTLKSADVITLSSLDSTRSGPLDESEILSLEVTLTRIVLDRSSGGAENNDGIVEVVVDTDNFDPFAVFIGEGDTVRWVWANNEFHTVTSGQSGALDAGALFDDDRNMAGDTFDVLFLEEGEYPYFSDVQADIEAGMAGIVIVDEDGEESDGADDSDVVAQEVVFEGMQIIDLVNLGSVSEILSSVEIPAGKYTKVRLHIENPMLELAANPGVIITDVQITANGRVFISKSFDIPAGDYLLVLDFKGIHLVETGSGKYVLTPQIRADVEIADADVEVTGEILAIDDVLGEIELLLENSTVTVLVTNLTLYLDELDNPITLAELMVGFIVEVEGLLNPDSTITADVIKIESI